MTVLQTATRSTAALGLIIRLTKIDRIDWPCTKLLAAPRAAGDDANSAYLWAKIHGAPVSLQGKTYATRSALPVSS